MNNGLYGEVKASGRPDQATLLSELPPPLDPAALIDDKGGVPERVLRGERN